MDYKGKRLLVLGSASVHVKLIKAAQKLGVYTITTDNVAYDDSPGKKVADEYWDLNIYDVDGIVEKARTSGIDGVIAGWLDPCQRPYFQICNKLGLPCYGTEEQFIKMTDKHAFKKMCVENGLDVIKEYTEKDIVEHKIEFPVFVKPVDSRGSRGQSLCGNYAELEAAVKIASEESSTGDILIEKYISNAQEFQVTYFFVDGNPYLIRTVDSYCGSEANKLEKVVACAISPSRHTETFMENANDKVVKMLKNLGLVNGPAFMQGFFDDGVFRFFDPGLRFPGVDYELIYEKVFGIDLMQKMVKIALGKPESDLQLPVNGVYLEGRMAAVLFPTLKSGTLKDIYGLDRVRADKKVVSLWLRHSIGEHVKWSYNVDQRLAEVDVLSSDEEDLRKEIKKVQDTLQPIDTNDNDMRFEILDVDEVIMHYLKTKA